MTLSEAKDIATIIGVIVAVVSLAATAYNININMKINRAKFWLDLRTAFSKHDEVHQRLRPGGDWTNNAEPANVSDMAKIEAYMGLFEHCESMLKEKLIDKETFRNIYSYRLHNLVANKWVKEKKLRDHKLEWERFIELLNEMKIKYD